MNDLVSVIVPTHNREDLLFRALQSIRKQTYTNFEVLVVDDVGNSLVKEIVNSFGDRRFRYIHNDKNKGATYSRNLGIQMSSGNFIAFLDDDDEWYCDKISLQMTKFNEDRNVAIVYGKLDINIPSLGLTYTTKPQKKGFIFSDLLIENYIGGTIIPMLNLHIIDKNECFFDTRFKAREEYDLWIRLCKKYKVDYVDRSLGIAYSDFEKLRISSDIKNYEEAIILLDKKYSDEIDRLSELQKKERKILQYRFLAAQAIKINNTKLARKNYLNILRIKFSLKNLFFYLVAFLSAKNLFRLRKRIKGI